ncbi:inositol metabolism protein opi10 [Moniliophthora roreri MCA 2997]|uniref:Inositol metabolism protein opi10 n=2 Tax=Moniliophthora roreri TaxID=221103 RepID=V2WZI6_MONRO|nr:inositol metabolism protein opi10 [Moniliophthora roreri MCA 2997]KAI3613167.1 inositol metabolism protein opi10 [Moniliophthora roreri]
MFGCCVAGRPLQTNLQQVDETHALFELPNASTINHVCVFLLGTVPFPDGYGATVHFHWPGKGFQLLGMLSNEKQSAIFKLRGSFSPSTSYGAFDTSNTPMGATADVTAMLGFSIEPLPQIQAQITALPSSVVTSQNDLSKNPTLLAERIVKHLFNYLSSFSGGGVMSSEVPVPTGVILKWYENFMGKIKNSGIGFLEREE